MTHRDRPHPESGAPPLSGHPSLSASLFSLVLSTGPAGSLWDQWLAQASPNQRRQVLELAGEQQVLFSHQLPSPEETVRTSVLPALLEGNLAGLPTPETSAVDFFDASLDDEQRQAVTCALHSPDICLIQGSIGSGKSRVIVEILRQAATRNWRTLLVAPSAAGLDRVLEPLSAEGMPLVLRCLGNSESLTALPACIARLTLEERLRHFNEQTIPAANQQLEQASSRRQARTSDETVWPLLEELARKRERHQQHKGEQTTRRAELARTLDDELSRETPDPTPFQLAWRESSQALREAEAGVLRQLTATRGEHQQLNAEKQTLETERLGLAPLVEAKQATRWWTGAFWKGVLQGNKQPRLEEIQTRLGEIEQALASLSTRMSDLTAQQQQLQDRRDEQRRQLLEKEQASRLALLDQTLADLRSEEESLDQQWNACCATLSVTAPRPASPDLAAINKAKQQWREQDRQDETDLSLKRQWADATREAGANLPLQLARHAAIVAAPITSLPPTGRGPFDLVVIEEAHRITESDLQRATRLGKRWVLVGEPPLDLPIAPPPPRPGKDNRAVVALPKPVFQRLWNQLHADPRKLRTTWRVQHAHLIARLQPLSPHQEAFICTEHLVDCPDIQLGILAAPRQTPTLVEVAFPASTSIEQAKEFLYRELQEPSVQASGSALRYREMPDKIIVELSPRGGASSVVSLEPGLREIVTTVPGHPGLTASLEFDTAAGWDQARVEGWLRDRLGVHLTRRTATLTRCYRPCPALGRFLAEMRLISAPQPDQASSHLSTPAVEFIAVPNQPRAEDWRGGEPAGRWSRGGTATASRQRTAGGAGLEIDLSAPPRVDVMPADLRAALPPHGLVNFLEARALIAALEDLVSDPDFPVLAADWQRQHATHECTAHQGCEPRRGVHCPTIAVISLFAAQTQLLRLLIQRSSVLSSSGIAIEVGAPVDFHQRECLVALISLTRSHSRMAVPFCDHPLELVSALTRATGRLMIFGDVGTLARRIQWYGALDHLDEVAGSHEQYLLSHLANHAQKQAGRSASLEESGRV